MQAVLATQAASGRCCLRTQQAHVPWCTGLLYRKVKETFTKLHTLRETTWRVSPTWQANLTMLLCWQITPLSARFPLLKATVRNICNFWDSDSNCQNRHRKSRETVQEAITGNTRDWTQSIWVGGGDENQNTRYTVWPLKRRQKTVLTVCTREELALAETRLGTLLSSLFMSETPSLSLSLTSSLSLSKLLRVLLVASDRNYNSHLIKPKKREKKEKEEEKEERKAGREGKKRRLIQL